MVWYQVIKSHMHSVIMIIYIAPLQGDYSGALSIPVRLKRTFFMSVRRVRENPRVQSQQGRQSWGLGVATPDFGLVESWMGRKILLYLIIYRKYVRKW